MTAEDEPKRSTPSRFQRHVRTLVWKSYLQRQRRWRLLIAETVFALIMFAFSVYVARPVFLKPLQAMPEPPLSSQDILASFRKNDILGYAPNVNPYYTIMTRAAQLLKTDLLSAPTEDDLNNILYNRSRFLSIKSPVVWVIWQPKEQNVWKFSIRSTERAKYKSSVDAPVVVYHHLQIGFLGVQFAVSQAILEYASPEPPNYNFSLVPMPVSPLMHEEAVRRSIAMILLCFTLALLPPVLDTEVLVVQETVSTFKRALRIRDVYFSSMYIGWLAYAMLTAMPICLLAGITLIFIFRWIHLLLTLLILLAYITVMIILAMIMAMFHVRASIACLWTTLFTILQTFLAELLVHHKYDLEHGALTYLLQIFLPPLGLVIGFNQFALLQTGRKLSTIVETDPVLYMVLSWSSVIMLYFLLLMFLQRTVGQDMAIGGQVSWKTILFKTNENTSKLHQTELPTGRERERLQAVDEFLAKAVSFRKVSKSIMGVPLLSNITFDIYRGEYTLLYADMIQARMLTTIDDLLTGLTHPDYGTINVLGEQLTPGKNLMIKPRMMGYCHLNRFLIDDLTVNEHLIFYMNICLWYETNQNIADYLYIRSALLLKNCDLVEVTYERVAHLDIYFRAQLCWVIAMLLEPRVVIMPSFTDKEMYTTVMKDKIVQYRKYTTIVKYCLASIHLEYGDRLFIFDNKILAFGGTPAYMFFQHGREYRIRIMFRSGSDTEDESISELLEVSQAAGATIRAHFGSLLILRLPSNPTDIITAFIKHLTVYADRYNISMFHISLPDSEEVCRRAIAVSRSGLVKKTAATIISRLARRRIAETPRYERNRTCRTLAHLRIIGWKYFTFHIYHRLLLIITLLATVVAGLVIGLSLSSLLVNLDREGVTKKMIRGEVLTVESLEQETILVLCTDNSRVSSSVADGYVLSETNATQKQVENMAYTVLTLPESVTEYLVTRAIDSPQRYVYVYAYGLSLKDDRPVLNAKALYSPIHRDVAAAPRSMARVYMALIRHYTGKLDASIEVTDDPLALDLTPWLQSAASPPLLIQFLLILSICHITLLPSMEHGLIRHTQCNAIQFSPARYWLMLYFYDLIWYWMLVGLLTIVMIGVMLFLVPSMHFEYGDLLVIPFMLIIYGVGCIPQAYVFSLGPWPSLNTMTFMIVNVVFGETTVLAKIFYGNTLNYVMNFMLFSPQFNMGYAFVKIKQIFLYNSECVMFKAKNLCSSTTLHKCCERCGVLTKCFSRKSYLTRRGVLMEVFATLITAVVFMIFLFLWEYKAIPRLIKYVISSWIYPDQGEITVESDGVIQEMTDVLDKENQIEMKRRHEVDTFGEYLLAAKVTEKNMGFYDIRDVYLGLGRGEALALSGLKHHGRLTLCEILAGYRIPSSGRQWCMSKWQLSVRPHMYARQISFCCEHEMLPGWMTVYNALELVALLRGVPHKYIESEIKNYLEALELQDLANSLIVQLSPTDRVRVHFVVAVIGAPPIIVLDEYAAYQKATVRRTMYFILYHLRKCGHAILISSVSVESHMPVTNRIAILVDGKIADIDTVNNLTQRYSNKGYTIVVHLKDEVDVNQMFAKYFKRFIINDTSEVLVNIQVLDVDLDWATVFERMEKLKSENSQVYTYIVTAIPVDYIYNSIIAGAVGKQRVGDFFSTLCFKLFKRESKMIQPSKEMLNSLKKLDKKYDITELKELPWSVIFQT